MKKVLIITGASKGFGRALASTYAISHLNEEILFILSGRNLPQLNELKDEITGRSTKHAVLIYCVDFSDFGGLLNASSQMIDVSLWNDAFEVILISNAGSLGSLAPIGSDSIQLSSLSQTINLNVTSYIYLTSEFLKRVKGWLPNQSKEVSVKIVNISSLAAIQAFESWGIYCAGKAARDMYYSVLAKEVETAGLEGRIKVLNYAPGPLDTDMQREIRENPEVDPATQETFRKMKDSDQLISPATSAKKLVDLLASGHWTNGSHLDYYDL